jgi:8-oxo-dGTP diphosphatase
VSDRTGPDVPDISGASGEWLVIDGVAHRRVVLCFVFRSSTSSREVLLGLKRTGFGTGRVVAIGGKIDGVETDLQAAVREVQEESGLQLRPSAVRRLGRISWTFPAQPTWSMAATLFAAEGDGTTPVPCEEIEPRWYGVDSIPWDSMWKDAPYWLPSLLADEQGRPSEQASPGGLLDVRIVMAGDNENVADAVVLRVPG